MTLAEFQQRFPSTAPAETLRLINHLDEGEPLQANRLYKRIVGGVSIPSSG
jgi:hypothetical protein